MKRQRIRNIEYHELTNDNNHNDSDRRNIPLQGQRVRRDNVLEAQIQNGDTLQAIALRYHCTISDIKRLNKIEKEIEIHARKTLKVPINAHSMLLNTNDELPIVHKSGQNSPKHINNNSEHDNNSSSSISHNQLLPNDRQKLDEKLLIASVSLASTSNSLPANDTYNGIQPTSSSHIKDINDIIFTSDITSRKYTDTKRRSGGIENSADDENDDQLFTDPLLMDLNDTNNLHGRRIHSGPHAIRGAPPSDLTCSGSDCDISWICLLIVILALCFAIPLIYVIYIAENPDHFHHAESG